VTEIPGGLKKWRHDLKNQLGIVIGYSELLLGEMDPADPRRPDVDEIHKAAERSIALLSSMNAPQDEP
jgi:signal transduction histidine kinase